MSKCKLFIYISHLCKLYIGLPDLCGGVFLFYLIQLLSAFDSHRFVAMAIGTASVVHYCGEDYMTALQEVALLEGTQYSYKCALIAEVDGQPAGALCGYDGALLESLRERTLEVIRKYNPAVRVLDDETEAGEFYLDSIGVLPQFRGLGIGAMLLCEMIRMAHENGHEHVALIVEEDNPSAEKLYTRLGFRRVGTRIFFGHRMVSIRRSTY